MIESPFLGQSAETAVRDEPAHETCWGEAAAPGIGNPEPAHPSGNPFLEELGRAFPHAFEHPCFSAPGQVLRYHFQAWLPPAIAQLKFLGLVQEWKPWRAIIVSADQTRIVFRLVPHGNWWRRWLGREPGLAVAFQLDDQRESRRLTFIEVEVRPCDCNERTAAELLRKVGPILLKNIQGYFQCPPDRRQQCRFPYERAMLFFPALPSWKPTEVARANSRDISLTGMRFWSAHQPNSQHLAICSAERPESDRVYVLSNVVRIQEAPQGGYEAAVRFLEDGLHVAPIAQSDG